MDRPVAFACKPPAKPVCNGAVCRCEDRAGPADFPSCKPGMHVQCTWGECMCVPGFPLPIASGEPAVAEGSCGIVAAVLVAGVKKALVACWISGSDAPGR